MSEKLKEFFNKIKDSQDFFLLWRLYNNPSNVIGSEQDMDAAEEEYYNLYDYCRLMMNNNLTKFIKLALHDNNFCGQDDFQTWRKLGFFLYDSIDFKKYYYMLDDPSVLPTLRGEISIQEYSRRKNSSHPKIPLLEMDDAYKKYEKLFKYNYPREQINNYDEKQAAYIRNYVNLKLRCIKEKTTKKESEALVLKQIERGDYSALQRYQLFNDSILSYRALGNLLCNNRFLDIIEDKLNKRKIDMVSLNDALNIIIMGINIKKRNIMDLDLDLDLDLVKNFNLQQAESLVSKIVLYKIKLSMILKKSQPKCIIKFPRGI